MTTENHRHHGYGPAEIVLTTRSMDGESGRIVLDLGTGIGTYRHADVDDGRGVVKYLGVGNADAVRRAIPQWPTTTTISGGVSTTTYNAGTGGRALRAFYLMPELVREINWCRLNATAEGIRLQGPVDLRIFVCAIVARLYGGQVSTLGLPWGLRELELSAPASPSALTNAFLSQTTSRWATFGAQANQNYAPGTVGIELLDVGAAGILDLSTRPDMRRVWATNSGLRRLRFAETDVLEELVVAYNSLGTYGGLLAWNRLPLSLKMLALGAAGTSSNTITGQVLAAGGAALAPDLDLRDHYQFQYLLANGAGLSGRLLLPTANTIEEIVCAKNALTSIEYGDQMLSPSVRLLLLSRNDGQGIAGTGQSAGAGIAVQNFSGATGLRGAYMNDCKSTAVVFPANDGLLHWQGYLNSITSITREGGGPNVIPTTLQIFRLGGGLDAAPAWDARLLVDSGATTSYGQTTTVGKRTLDLTGGNGLVETDARHSNIATLVPQASKVAQRRLLFSPIGSYSWLGGYNAVTEANNNAFTTNGSLNLTGYDAVTHLIVNHCRLTNGALTLPGGAGQPVGAGTWAQNTANPVLQLELSGNNFSTCPFGPGDFKNCLSLELAGHRTAGYPKLSSIPTGQMAQLIKKSVHNQALTGPLTFFGNDNLQILHAQVNRYGAPAGNAPTVAPPATQEFVFDDQTPGGVLVNKLDFSASNRTSLRVISLKNARLAYVNLPAKPVTDTVDLRQNAGVLTAANVIVPANFSMPNTANAFRVGGNALGTLPAGLLSAVGTRIVARALDFSANGFNQTTVDALISAVFTGRAAFAAGAKSLTVGGIGDTNATPSGIYQQPAGYMPGMSAAAMNAAAATWTGKEKLWVLANAFAWTVSYTP